MKLFSSNKNLTENEIRASLRNWISINFALKENHILVNELGFYNKNDDGSMDNSYRADLALIKDTLIGFEIKSEKDSLKRWDSQKIAYTNVFDEVWLCTHSKHLVKSLDSTPNHIGILLIDDTSSIAIARQATYLHGLNDVYDFTSMLWREELNELSELYNIHIKARTTKRQLRAILADQLNLNDVRSFCLNKLKIRKA